MSDSESGSSTARSPANAFTLPLDYYLKSRTDTNFAGELSTHDGGTIDVWLKRISDFRSGVEPPYDIARGQYSALADALALRLNMAVDALYPPDYFDPAKSAQPYTSYWENRLQPRLATRGGLLGAFIGSGAQIVKPIPGMTRKEAAAERQRIAGQRQQGKKSLSRWGNGHRSNRSIHTAAKESAARADAILNRSKKESAKNGKGKNKAGADAPDASDREPKALPIAVMRGTSTKFFRCPIPSVAAWFSTQKEPQPDGFNPGWFATKAHEKGVTLDNFRGPFNILNGIADAKQHIDARGSPSASLRVLAAITGVPAEDLVKEWHGTLEAAKKRAPAPEPQPPAPSAPKKPAWRDPGDPR